MLTADPWAWAAADRGAAARLAGGAFDGRTEEGTPSYRTAAPSGTGSASGAASASEKRSVVHSSEGVSAVPSLPVSAST